MSDSVKVYWNNICLISRLEEKYIKEEVGKSGMNIQFEYFGLGREKKLSEQIRTERDNGEINADIILTTDLDVFQDKRLLFNEIENFENLEHMGSLFPVRKEIKESEIPYEKGFISPFITIPLVIVVNKGLLNGCGIPESFGQLCDERYSGKVVYGGIDTSAGRSLLMSMWYMYGEDMLRDFMDNSVAASMPAAAFNMVMKGQFPIAIVPSIFALRMGIGNLSGIWPVDGAISIPSYLAVKKGTTRETLEFMSEKILSKDKQELLTSNANIIPSHPEADIPAWAGDNGCKLVYPSWKWIESLDYEHFDEICKKVRLI